MEKINAYPPRFHLTFYNYDSMQHLSIVIKVELEKSKHQKKNKDENKILSFFINTPDYAEFTHSTIVSPLDQSGTVIYTTIYVLCVCCKLHIYAATV